MTIITIWPSLQYKRKSTNTKKSIDKDIKWCYDQWLIVTDHKLIAQTISMMINDHRCHLRVSSETIRTHSELVQTATRMQNIVKYCYNKSVKNKSHLNAKIFLFNFALLLFKYDFFKLKTNRKFSFVSNCHKVWHLGDIFEFNSRQTSAQQMSSLVSNIYITYTHRSLSIVYVHICKGRQRYCH